MPTTLLPSETATPKTEPRSGRISTPVIGLSDQADSDRAWRWRAVDDPQPGKAPTRFQRLFSWLILYNEY